ncbi:MAG: PqqD family protein [Clostridia bacterium]|nr:PqqD family protein [Clostridia bacterium]
MKINKDFTIQKVGSSFVAVPVGETSKNFHGMVRLNETGAFLWKKLTEADQTEDSLVAALLEEYDVSEELARKDVQTLVHALQEGKIL